MSQCLLCGREAVAPDSNYCDLHDRSGSGGGEMIRPGPMTDAHELDVDYDELDVDDSLDGLDDEEERDE